LEFWGKMMSDFDEAKAVLKKGVSAVGKARGAQVATVTVAGWVGVTVAAPVLIAVGVATGLFSFFGDD